MSAETTIDVISYLASKGLYGRKANGPEVAFPCFFDCNEPPESRKKKLYVNSDEGFYECKVCGAAGGTYLLQQHFGDDPKRSDIKVEDAHTKRKILNWAAEVGSAMLQNNDDIMLYLLNERGLSPETIVENKLGFIGNNWSLVDSLPEQFTKEQLKGSGLVYRDGPRAGQDFFYNHILIPYVQRGQVVQIRGKLQNAKYFTGPGEPVRIYGLDDLDDAEDVLITEGEFDRMVVKQHLQSAPDERVRKIAVIGLAGANGFVNGSENWLVNAKRIYLALDPDDTGKREAVKIKERLGARARIVELPPELPKCDWTEYLLPVPPDANGTWHRMHPHAGHSWRDIVALMGNASGKRIFSMRESGVAYHLAREMHDGIQTGFSGLDALIQPGLLPGQVVVVLAKTGCIQGDAEIAVNRGGKGFTIKLRDLLDRWEGRKYAWDRSIPTYVQREVDGQVRLGQLVNAWRSGIKTTYTVTTHTGRTIRATDEHPFLTERGWLRLDEMVVGDLVHVRGERSSAGRKSKSMYARRTVPLHPYAGRRNVKAGGHSVSYHRLVAEAGLNGLDPGTFIQRCIDGPVDGLRFLDPKVWAVHHIDHDPSNNEAGNLKVCTHQEHAEIHAAEGTTRNVGINIAFERIESIELFGEEETYDLEVADDPHNFLANGFVVHNTGKTVFCCNLAYNMKDRKVLFISLEMTREEVYNNLRHIYWFHHPTATRDEMEEDLKNVLICDENKLSDQDFRNIVDEYEVETGSRPEIVIVDYLGYYARGAEGKSPYEKTTNAIMQLKAHAKGDDPKKRFCVVTPHQVNRLAKEGKPIDMDDARDSGAVEETADFMFSIWKPEDALVTEANAQPSGRLRLEVLKSRHGGKGKSFLLQFDALTLAVVEADSPEARRAQHNTNRHSAGETWDQLRADETRPRQQSLAFSGRT